MPKAITILSAPDYQALIAMTPPQPSTPTSHDRYLRDRLIIHLMLEAGLRSSEVSLIKHHDCFYNHLPARVLQVTQATAKREQPRDIPLTPFLTLALQEFRPLEHPAHTLNPSPPLLSSDTYPKGTSPRTNQRIVSTWSLKLLRRQIWPHVLRHTFAMRLLDSGCQLPVLQALLGHKHLSSTQVYMHTNSLHTTEAIARMSQHTPTPTTTPNEPDSTMPTLIL